MPRQPRSLIPTAAVKALIVANEFLEKEVGGNLMQALSHAYARGRFKTYTG